MANDTLSPLTRRAFIGGSSIALAAAEASPMGEAQQDITRTSGAAQRNGPDGPIFVRFTASTRGMWRVDRISAVTGEGLVTAPRIEVVESATPQSHSTNSLWQLRGVTSNVRYTHHDELAEMRRKQEGLDRPEATKAALIPIRKTSAWWSLAQDERRGIFEETSHHIATGIEYLPQIARRLYHSRELAEPFDFLTWFEYAPQYSEAFEELASRLRATKEWTYVDREVDIRLTRI